MKKNNLLTIVLIIVIIVLLFGVVALILVTQLNKDKDKETSIDEIIEVSVDVPEITTNLADDSYVKLQLKIQTDSKDAAEELTKRDFQINNILIEELSEMTSEDLKGKQGKLRLESTIKAQLNELMQNGEVEQVYITSYIIQ